MAEPRPSFDTNSSNSIPLWKRIKGIERINMSEIIERLINEDKIYYRDKNRVKTIINAFLKEVKVEIWRWKQVRVARFWNFYPAKLKDRKHYCWITWNRKTIKGSTMLRFMQARPVGEYFKENFKWIKWKDKEM